MAARRTIDFLPKFFQTETNKKFLSATLDQLVSEPSLTRLNGYIGRKNAVNYKVTDNYLTESSASRSNYQLEPSVVTKDSYGNVNFVSGYQDVINKLGYYGVDTSNHSRLFGNEFYTYDGLIDFDKFVNFSQYYWLPRGPDSVNVFSNAVPINATFDVTADPGEDGARVTGSNNTLNPTLTLARGGSYTFTSSNIQNLWLQVEPGISGKKRIQANISTRDILGVYNNGTNSITFNVPEKSAQDQYLAMERVAEVDLATPLNYSDIDGKRFDAFLEEYGSIDGQRNIAGKILIFLHEPGIDPDWKWESKGRFDSDGAPFDFTDFAPSRYIPTEQRFGMWQINNDTTPDAIIELTYLGPVAANKKVLVREGVEYGNREMYKNTQDRYELVPIITAILDTIFYQDGSDPDIVGEIKLVDPIIAAPLDVSLILGQAQYISPNGVDFTNGLKVRFNANVEPAMYAEREFYVEGVGHSIRLVPVDSLVTPEPYIENEAVGFDIELFDAGGFGSTLNAPLDPTYITINRSSLDLNPWSRNNRWFHQDVITATSRYNNFIPVIDQNSRAKRPIIEFDADVQLFNFGKIGKTSVTLFDTATTDAFSDVEGQSTYTVDGITLTPGMRVIFSADTEDTVRNKIYEVNFIDPAGDGLETQLHLTLAADGEVEIYDNVVVEQGSQYQGASFWYNGTSWTLSQQKNSINVEPLFDVFDSTGVSFSDTNKYASSTFAGNKILSFKRGSSNNDAVLGFPLTYRNFNNIGDIVFENNYNNETFTYTDGDNTVTQNVSYGVFHSNVDRDTYNIENVWRTVAEDSKQFQEFSFIYTGSSKFRTEIAPAYQTNIPNSIVYVNNQVVYHDLYTFETINGVIYLNINGVALTNGDKINAYIYNEAASPAGFFQIPTNLDNNSVNINFSTLTLGQMRNHVEQAFVNSIDTIGAFPGNSNIRDIIIKDNPGKILQHSAPATYAALFLTHETASFERSIELARREYSKFKNKFLEIAMSLGDVDADNIPGSVDIILSEINSFKTVDMPWYASDMVPYGEDKNVIIHNVFNETATEYEITSIFDSTTPSNQAVLVYLNDVQLVSGIDYTFSTDRPAIVILPARSLSVGDVLRIEEFNDTDGCWIPETPTKMGMYPLYTPEKIVDDSYRTAINVIVGHDGSKTPAFDDFRDELLIELERRIHNNVKVVYDVKRFDINSLLPGKFRTTNFSRTEVDNILGRSFLKWVGTNRLDYISNPYYQNSDGFTWSYKKFVDRLDGETLPGGWRGIYRYYFDTETPHMTPWEMLGFSEMPDWWEATYGPAPYAKGNEVLWEDLEAGRIVAGERAGIDPLYARPGLTTVIPANEYGELTSPHEFIVKQYETRNTNLTFSVGDVGPVEAAWRRSSDYPYAVQILMALTHPGKFFGLQLDTHRYVKDTGLNQYVFTGNNLRITQDDILINGETNSAGEVNRCAGYLNWIADYARSLGLNADKTVGDLARNFTVQLSYKFAGFTDKKMLKVFAEQASPTSTNESIMIPDEDYALTLNKSVSLKRLVYSAVIITKTNAGWSVEGYDTENPYFTIIPSDVNGKVQAIDVAGVTAYSYSSYRNEKLTVPYGFEFTTRQQIVDFLLSYERYLKSQGFRFNAIANDLGETQNWNLSAKEFIAWSLQGWAEGNMLVVSPVGQTITVRTQESVIDSINDVSNTSKILNVNFQPLADRKFSVSRVDGITEIRLEEDVIGFAELIAVQYEHVGVFNNATVFNDILYQPELGNRQSRLKVIGKKTANWDGTLHAPGFILNQTDVPEWQPGVDYKKADLVEYKGQLFVARENLTAADEFVYDSWAVSDFANVKQGLLPNFVTKTTQIEDAYDLEGINLESDIDIFSKGLIGFRQRNYLNEIGLDDATQVKFYQGYIKEKGTRKSIDSLTNASIERLSSDISVYEDWAIRVGEYGAMDSNQVIDITLVESQFASSPSFLTLLNNSDLRPLDRVGIKLSELYKRPRQFDPNLFLTKVASPDLNTEMKTAGPVRQDEVDFTVFDLANVSTLDANLDDIGATSQIWTAKNYNGVWDVLRVNQADIQVVSIFNTLDGYILVETGDTHNLSENDVIIIKNVDPLFNGFYKVYNVPALNSVLLEYNKSDLTGFEAALNLSGYILTTTSMKFDYASSISNVDNWRDGDLAWVTNTDDQQSWAVYEKSSPWQQSEYVRAASTATGAGFGTVIAKSVDESYVFVGKPAETNGRVVVFERAEDGSYTEAQTLNNGTASTDMALASGNDGTYDWLAVGNPSVSSNAGQIYVYKRTGSTFSLVQTIAPTTTTGHLNGASLAMSADAKWLYIGSPGQGRVYVYALNGSSFTSVTSIAVSSIGFGTSLATTSDGTHLLIGAPYNDLLADGVTSVTDSGVVYVYDRKIEAFAADGSTTSFTTITTIPSVYRVTVDDVEVDSADYVKSGTKTIVFDNAPDASSIVRIETNAFTLMQKVYADNSEAYNYFGTAVAICTNDCSLYVGSPNDDNEEKDVRSSGEVYRFANQGRVYGTITGTVTNPTVTTGNSIRIDDFEIVFTGTTLASVVDDINDASLVGITASAVGNKLVITADSTLSFAKLRILPGSGTALTDLGLDVFAFMQTIENPNPEEHSEFGSVLSVSSDASKLFVGCPSAATIIDMQLDSGTTTLDDKSTTMSVKVDNSGAAYVYQYLGNPLNTVDVPGKMTLAQRLISDEISVGDQFGASGIFVANTIVVGMPGDDNSISNGGQVAIFTDADDTGAWQIIRAKEALVDVDAINKVQLYNTVSGDKLEVLDFIDPAKGKILGLADQELSYISDVDPAYYTYSADSKLLQPSQAWSEEQVGKLWWDTTNSIWLNYEQGDFAYRSAYWARMFPGSTVNVYEWVESAVPPAQYTTRYTNGTPKSTTEYTTHVLVDKITGAFTTKYYFWITDTSEVPNTTGRSLTTGAIEDMITTPASQGIPYAAFLSPSTVGVWNVAKYLSASDVALSINYDAHKNDNLIHSEYALVQEDNPNSAVPRKIIRKIVDSLCGQDSVGNAVPDTSLPTAEKYGIGFRPRQSIFVDQQAALKLLVQNFNNIFAETASLSQFPTDGIFYSAEETPVQTVGGYSEVVPDLTTFGYINISAKPSGYKVLVEYDANYKGWAIYTRASSSATTWTLVDRQSYNTTNYWTVVDWFADGFSNISRYNHVVQSDYDIATLALSAGETIKVVDGGNGKFKIYYVESDMSLTVVGLQNSTVKILDTLWQTRPAAETRNILNGLFEAYNGTSVVNQQLFVLIRYALAEQKYIDWAFKTSFITVLHKIRKLEQYANYQKDNQTFVQNFIDEVKPYRTKIREYLLDYEGNDYWDGDVTDFDLPGYYDVDFQRFRSPSGEHTKDPELYLLPENSQWYENYGLYLESVTIEHPGEGYDIAPQIKITGGGGEGAEAYAVVRSGGIYTVVVTNPGSGYTSTPTITLTGGNGTGASLSVRMSNGTTRKIKTTIKYDRITYDSEVLEWEASTDYTAGDVVSYAGEVYSVDVDFTSGSTFGKDNLTVIPDEDFENANDRTLAFYQPRRGMRTKDLTQIFSGVTYPGVQVIGGYPIPSWEADTDYTIGMLVSNLDEDDVLNIYRVTETFTSGSSFSNAYLELATDIGPDGQHQIVNDEYDTVIRSSFTDLALGTRPQDINIDGGEFVDTFVSHAPEELIPGIVFDAVDIQVFTHSPVTAQHGAGPEIYMNTFSGDGVTTEFDVEVIGEHHDSIIVYTKQTGYAREGVDYTFNRNAKTITFNTAPAVRNSVYVYLLSTAGVNQIHDEILIADGSTVEFSADHVDYTLVTDSFALIDGVKTTAYTLSANATGTSITFDTAPTADQHVHFYLYSGEPGKQLFSEFYTQFTTVASSPVYPADYTIDLDRNINYAGPLSGNMVVEVNNVRLRPANNRYYMGDGSTVEFFIPTTVDVNPDLISDNDINVYLNGVELQQYIDYAVVPSDGSSLRSVTLLSAPTEEDEVIISLQTGAQFRLNGNSQLLIAETTPLPGNAVIKVTSFSNHDMIKFNTQVFIGSTAEAITSEPGFDEGGYDSFAWDADTISTVSRPVYTVQRPITNTNYVWATIDGVKMLPNYDFKMRDPYTIEFGQHLGVSANAVVVITTFTEVTFIPPVGFRIFKNMVGEVEYLRISGENTAILAQDLNVTDETIYVDDVTKLPVASDIAGVPGVVFINGERITYYDINYENNSISRLRRSTQGTGAATVHVAGSRVVDGSQAQAIPGTAHSRIWLNAGDGTTTAAAGDGLSLSTSQQARFLKSKPSYLPG